MFFLPKSEMFFQVSMDQEPQAKIHGDKTWSLPSLQLCPHASPEHQATFASPRLFQRQIERPLTQPTKCSESVRHLPLRTKDPPGLAEGFLHI